MDFSNSNLTEIKNAFLMFQEENAGNECQIVKVTIKVEQLTSPNGEYHELLKFRALKKLSSADIHALGLESIMVYMKTKYG